MHFNPQGSREPRLKDFSVLSPRERISIHKALASLDGCVIHAVSWEDTFQSTRLSRASTFFHDFRGFIAIISIHKALASLDLMRGSLQPQMHYFNPQGSREPRRGNDVLFEQ